ncbi:MAG: D-aminoacyl-tRNA deacylase [Candidatus Micrarchaeota archaeon]
MKGAILFSSTNAASLNIVKHLESDWKWKKRADLLYSFSSCAKEDCCTGVQAFGSPKSIIEIEPPAELCEGPKAVDYFLYASTHKSESGQPALTAHVPGNWNAADFGGSPKTLNTAYAGKLKQILQLLAEGAKKHGLDWPVNMEVDHHGPTPSRGARGSAPSPQFQGEQAYRRPARASPAGLARPRADSCSPDLRPPLFPALIFVEIGSGPGQWENELAGQVVAEAMMKALFRPAPPASVYLGIGGGHYAPKFTHVMLESEKAVGHVLPKYHAASFDAAMLKQAMEKTVEKVEGALVDWKGLGKEERDRIVALLEKEGVKYKRA